MILDILFLAYKGVDPAELVKDRETARKDGLAGLLMEEDRERRMKDRKGVSRHGRFGTTIAVRSVSGTSNCDVSELSGIPLMRSH